MNDLFLLTETQVRGIEPYFPISHGAVRVDDRRVTSGILCVIRNGLKPPRLFNKIFAELARKASKPSRQMIDATHLKAHRTAASLFRKV